MALRRNANEPIIEDVEGHARNFQSNEPVTEDEDTEGHVRRPNANEPVNEDEDA